MKTCIFCKLYKKGASYTEKVKILSPAYFPRFRCKCGDCRSVCCRGWRITVTEHEYDRLRALACSPALRGSIDDALRLFAERTPERYGYINDGDGAPCRMLDADGWCALQKEAGETAQPSVCRLYPRAIRPGDPIEAVCSGSCEKTVEMLMEDIPLTLITTEVEIRSAVPEYRDDDAQDAALRERCLSLWLAPGSADDRFAALAAALSVPAEAADLPRTVLLRLLAATAPGSPSIRGRGADALALFDVPDGAARESDAAARLTRALPVWEHYLTNVMANHLFYVRFPLVGSDISHASALRSFRAAYSTVRLLILAEGMHGADARIAFADAAASALRFIEHTDFYHRIPRVLHTLAAGENITIS